MATVAGNCREKTRDGVRWFFITFLCLNTLWFVPVSISAPHFWNLLGILGLASAAGLVTGGFFGFLFGIPRSLSSPAIAMAATHTQNRVSVEPNTNLEQVSDWLTKVIVGISLAEFGRILQEFTTIESALQTRMGSSVGGVASIATFVAYFFSGFLWGYFESRTSLMATFALPTLEEAEPIPQLSSLRPMGGAAAGGEIVTIGGTGLANASGVSFGQTPAVTFKADSDAQITATSPPGTGTVDVTVITPNGISTVSSLTKYSYAAAPAGPLPQLLSVNPTSGAAAGGDVVTIKGTGLANASAVSFGQAPAVTFNADSDAQITATSPPGTGTIDVLVRTPSGTSAPSLLTKYTYADEH